MWLEWELIIQQGEPRFNNISKVGGERSIDTIGPFEPDEHGNTYIIAAVAGFSRFVMLEAATDASGTAAAKFKFLLKIAGIFGRPRSLRHDRGITVREDHLYIEEVLTKTSSTTCSTNTVASGDRS